MDHWASLVAQTIKNHLQCWRPGFNPWVVTRLSDFTFTFHFHALEKEMATHPSMLAWRIPMDRGACRATVHGVIRSQT